MVDNVFKYGALLAYLKSNGIEMFDGGSQIQENMLYGSMLGAPYAKGAQFNISKIQNYTGLTFVPKFYEVNVTEFLEDTEVFVKGPEAKFRLVEADMQAAANTMAAQLGISIYLEGQSAGYTLFINGMAEAVNDGSTASWNGTTYANYGTIARAGTVSPALNARVTNVGGPITYEALELAYNQVTIGSEHPNLILSSNQGVTYINYRFQPAQRVEGTDPTIGFTGLKFKGAMIMQDQYAPSPAISGTTDPVVTRFMQQAGFPAGYPTVTTETIWGLNTKFWRLWTSNSPLYGFGFTGFKRSADTTTVAGQYLWSGDLTCQSPRLQFQLTGITG